MGNGARLPSKDSGSGSSGSRQGGAGYGAPPRPSGVSSFKIERFSRIRESMELGDVGVRFCFECTWLEF